MVRHLEALLQKSGERVLAYPLAPMRQRRAVERGNSWRNTTSPQKHWKHLALAQPLIGEVVHVLEDQHPATNRVGKSGCTPTR